MVIPLIPQSRNSHGNGFEERQQSLSETTDNMAKQRIAVAIVERDEKTMQELIRVVNRASQLERVASYATLDAAHADFARRASQKTLPDVLVWHNGGNDMSEMQKLRKLHGTYPRVQVLFVAQNLSPESLTAALAAGASGYIDCPYPPSKLIAAIKELAVGGAHLSPVATRVLVQSFRRSASPAENLLAKLSPREQETLKLLAQGLSYQEIADALGIKRGTVQRHLHSIYEKINVRSRSEAVHRFYGG